MGIIAAGQITVVDLSDAPVLNTFITASRPTTQTYSKDSGTYKPSYASTPQVLTLKLTKAGSTANIIDSISSLHWFVVDGPVKTEITSKDNTANEYISGAHNEILTTKLDIDKNKGSKRYEVMGIWPDPSTGLDVQFGGYIDLLLTQNGATGPQGPQGETGNGIANTVITYGLSMSDTTEPATWSSEMPALVKGMYLWTRTVIIYTNGSSTTSYQISYIAQDADATAEIDKAKQELLEKLETVRDESLEAVDEAKQQLVTVRDESLAAAEEAKQGLANVNTKVDSAKAEIDKAKQDLTNVASELNTAKQDLTDSVTAVNTKVDNAKEELTQAKQQITTVADDLSTAKQDFQNAVSAVDTKATNLQSDLTQAKQDLASQAQQLQEQATAQSELTNRVSSVEETANGTKTTVSELSKTVDQNGKDITSVTARTKVVEDDLAGTKTTLSQVKTTADSTSQKTATLETGLNGLNAKFENLSVGTTNHFLDSAFETTIQKIGIFQNGNVYTPSIDTTEKYDGYNTLKIVCEDSAGVDNPKITYRALAKLKTVQQGKLPDVVTISFWGKTDTAGMVLYTRLGYMGYLDSQNVTLTTDWKRYIVHVKTSSVASNEWTFKFSKAGTVWIAKPQFEFSAIASDYHSAEEDTSSKVAEYKQNADQNYASLQTTVQNLDGTVQHNKTVADQTAAGFKTRIESLETYKDGESERANAYFESAKTETAKQLTAERTAIAKDYVAKSTYTSDVTGIRNDLTATTTTANTTKTNLANYQASNDRAVANLQSNLQTANGNISSLKTKVEAVPGQITSAVSAVEGKIPTSVGGRNLLAKTNQGKLNWDWSISSGGTTAEDYNVDGVKAVKLTRTKDSPSSWDYIQYKGLIRNLIEPNTKYTLSFDVKPNVDVTFTASLKRGDSGAPLTNATSMNKATANQWTKASCVLTSKTTLPDGLSQVVYLSGMPTANGNWLIIKNIKLEKGVVSSDWSPAPEDYDDALTQVKSEIKQTADGITLLATKTELSTAKNELQSGINTATNKANNNAQTISTHTNQISALNTGLQAKVSQTDFNTLSGRVTTAENNITAKANELSSKITSVEGKIPTNLDSLNLMTGTRDWSTKANKWHMGPNWSTESWEYQGLKVHSTQKGHNGSHQNIFVKKGDVITFSFFAKATNTLSKIKVSSCWDGSSVYQAPLAGVKESIDEQITITSEWKRYSKTIHITSDGSLQFRTEYDGATIPNGNTFYVAGLKLSKSELDTGYSENPTDAASDIRTISSELKQTKDGMTLLATKTELNTAKSDLQSGISTATNKANAAQNTANNAQNKANSNAQTISTHTTQISALNTGLQAKVSQTDFNTLSGRVTTAENNITAKANELSSKITSVEGKIPTNLDSLNLMTGTRDWSTKANKWHMGPNWSTESWEYQGLKVHSTQKGHNGSHQNIFVKKGDVITFSFFAKATNTLSKIKVSSCWDGSSVYQAPLAGVKESIDEQITITSEWKRYSKTIHITSDGSLQFRTEYDGATIPNGNTFYVAGLKLSKSELDTGYSENPTDAASDIRTISSELKQTKDGITLLATKTELNNAKNELQSGINTATNKANNNAQTISTHTTQISALNTGLQAKVSQTDFNTLSGRVTNAENNITAKANELSSKITSVEGKIPTSVGGRNLLSKTNQGKKYWAWSISSGGTTVENFDVDGANAVKLTRTSDASFTWHYIRYDGLIRNLIEPNTKYTLSFDVKPSVDVTFGASLQRGDGGSKLTNAVNMNKALANQWNKVSCVLTSNTTLPDDLSQVVYLSGMPVAKGNYLIIKNIKLEKGIVSSDWTPAPEDTISQINAVSSELKQTADGITLLATKTELNNAKNDLQSGINTATNKANSAQSTANNAQNKANNNAQTISTHTNQISALNTGLQAKVSQTDFNTLSGRVTTAENNITAKANELSSKITSVEGKIPTNLDSLNLMTGTRDWSTKANKWHMGPNWSTESWEYQGLKVHSTQKGHNGSHQNIFVKKGDVITFSFFAKATNTLSKIKVSSCWDGSSVYQAPLAGVKESIDEQITITSEWKRYSKTIHITSDGSLQFRTEYDGATIPNGNTFYVAGLKLSKSELDTGYSENPTDAASDIRTISSELKQTKDGMTLLATKTELNTAKSDLQSGISTATNKANAAQNTANNAQNKANSNAQTISTHTTQISALNTGLQAKVSQTDFNTLSGRVTTAENNITAKANELSSKITSVEGKIPKSSGGRNLAQGTSKDWSTPFTGFSGVQNTCPSLYKVLTDGLVVGDTFKTRIILKYTNIVPASGKTAKIWLQGAGNVTAWNSGTYPSGGSHSRSISGSGEIVFELTDKIIADHLKNSYWDLTFRTDWVASGSLQWKLAKAERGMFFTDWSPAPEDTINQISSLSSEFKQTTDSIKASVTSLDKSTVKSSSLTINSDGIVMKAGKSTTDVANAIGSYFAVNQNAIDLFADKIKVKGNMIVNGTITGDKIKASSVDVSKIVGIDANFIKSKIEYAMIDWLKGKTITAYNDNMTIDLQNGRVSFKDGSNAVYRQTPDGIHTGFLHFEADSLGGVYAAFGTTSTRQGINSKSSEFAGIRCYRVSANGDSHDAKIDKIEVIGDNVQFGHTYHPNGTIGGGFIMNTAAYYDDPPYSLNRMVSSIESLWRILYVHAKNVGYNLSHQNFIRALNDEYNAWHDMHNR